MTDFAEQPTSTIQLSNPVAHHFASFAFGNSLKCDRVVEQNSAKGLSVVICGAGPSLVDHAAEHCGPADHVWGCNSAVTWLTNHGHKVTHGFTVDQTPEMLNEWASIPEVEYLLASTVHPHLTDMLVDAGRRITWFHNYCGMNQEVVEWADADGVMIRAEWEEWMYALLYPHTVRVGSGLNAVTRAIDLAEFMGYEKITVLGADCAIRVTKPMPKYAKIGSRAHTRWLTKHTVMHADGGNAIASGATAVTMTGTVDGREWTSKPDMLITAVFLVRMMRRLGDRLNVVGDTFPNALKFKDDAYLSRLPSLTDSHGNQIHLG